MLGLCSGEQATACSICWPSSTRLRSFEVLRNILELNLMWFRSYEDEFFWQIQSFSVVAFSFRENSLQLWHWLWTDGQNWATANNFKNIFRTIFRILCAYQSADISMAELEFGSREMDDLAQQLWCLLQYDYVLYFRVTWYNFNFASIRPLKIFIPRITWVSFGPIPFIRHIVIKSHYSVFLWTPWGLTRGFLDVIIDSKFKYSEHTIIHFRQAHLQTFRYQASDTVRQ